MRIVRNALLEVLDGVEVDKPVLLPYSEEELKEIIFDKIIVDYKEEYYILSKELKKIFIRLILRIYLLMV